MADNKTEHKWTMIIDLDKCTGCQACVVACHAENNVPIAGEDQVVAGRSQHWIRIERYWEGEYPNVQARFLPVLCQQCGHAPCEPVCPVYASYHSEEENINMQVYNRCIGTRFCGNNCPYRVRVFNYYPPKFDAPLEQQLNPEVTVRGPGVMEKCNFCIQRIRHAREIADAEQRPIRDGEVQPACVQACPTTALVFGDKYDENSVVSQMLPNERQFKLLEQLGTEPSVYYLRGGESNVGE
jgi:molybdopterin-containing oxidoreductase family iron-sulfur binding subunit